MKTPSSPRSDLRRILLDEASEDEFEAFSLRILEDAHPDAKADADADGDGDGDAAFAEALAQEDDLIDEYVRGELDAETAQRVEATLLAGPEGRRRREFARALRRHVDRRAEGSSTVAAPVLAAAGLDPGTVTAADATRGPWWHRLLASLQAPAARPAWALCAFLLLALLLQAAWWMQRTSAPSGIQATGPASGSASGSATERTDLEAETSELRTRLAERDQQIESLRADLERLTVDAEVEAETPAQTQATQTQTQTQTPAQTDVVTLLLAAATRGASEVPTLRLPPDAREAELQIDLTGVTDAEVVRARLLDPGGFPVWGTPRAEVERQDGFQALRLRVPAQVLTPGVHRLVLESAAPGEVPRGLADFEVRVTTAPG